MNPVEKITDAEFEVMRVIWEKAPLTGAEVVAALERQQGWKSSTILTLVRRLVQKKAVKARKSERGILYMPLVSREACLEAAGAAFQNRFFGQSLVPMLAYFTKTQKLTEQERCELRRLLDEEEGKIQ